MKISLHQISDWSSSLLVYGTGVKIGKVDVRPSANCLKGWVLGIESPIPYSGWLSFVSFLLLSTYINVWKEEISDIVILPIPRSWHATEDNHNPFNAFSDQYFSFGSLYGSTIKQQHHLHFECFQNETETSFKSIYRPNRTTKHSQVPNRSPLRRPVMANLQHEIHL